MEWVTYFFQRDWFEIIVILVGFSAFFFTLKKTFKEEIGFLRKEIKEELNSLNDKVDSIDRRLSRLEGRFEERGYWESRHTNLDNIKKVNEG